MEPRQPPGGETRGYTKAHTQELHFRVQTFDFAPSTGAAVSVRHVRNEAVPLLAVEAVLCQSAGAATPTGTTEQRRRLSCGWSRGPALGCFRFEVTDDRGMIDATPVAERSGRQTLPGGRRRQQCPVGAASAAIDLPDRSSRLEAAVDALNADTMLESYHQAALAGWEQRAIVPKALGSLP